MNGWDYAVLAVTILGIAAYGIARTRGRNTLKSYLRGGEKTGWLAIGLSVMATQASAITFLSTPGQGFEDGMGFVQNYFGAPFALILIAAVFLPLYQKAGVHTAYEFLGGRFDSRTRLFGAALFLLQRGLAAGITIYAPAIVLSALLGWRLDLTIVGCGLVVIAYTVSGGTAAVSVTQKYQMGVIFAGMAAAFFVLLAKLPRGLSFHNSLLVAGGFHKLQGVDFSLNVNRRYTFWSGLFGGFFLALSYFGTDQSQVQRYLQGSSLRQSRLGLMFNAVCKVPMQTFILLLGALLFVFYQFAPEPLYFNRPAWERQMARPGQEHLRSLAGQFAAVHAEKSRDIQDWLRADAAGDPSSAARARAAAVAAAGRGDAIRDEARGLMRRADKDASANDADYVFITFVLDQLPHGLIGLLLAVFFAATMSSKAAELNALASTTTVDFYRHLVRREGGDAHYVAATRWFTAFWGLVAIAFALFARLAENLIQAVNILGSLFYGVMLGLFLVAFFLRGVGGRAVFWAGLAAQALVLVLYAVLPISYLWYNLIGCAACMGLSLILQAALA